MNRRVNRGYVLIPVAYIGVIFLLFFLQYYGDELFRANISDLTISGKLNDGEDLSNGVADVQVEYRGLSFTFGETSGLLIEHPDGTTETLAVQSYETREDGFDVVFARNARVAFSLSGTSESDDEELYVQPVLPADLLPVRQVLMNYQVTGDLSGVTDPVQTSLTVEHDARTYHLTVPPRSEIRVSNQEIVVPGDLERQTIRYTRLVGDPQDVVSVWFADDTLAIPADELDARIDGYIDSAYEGWQQRFNSGAGTWEMKSGTAEFREEIAVAYLSEAWARDEYTRAFNQMRRAADLHPELVGLESAVFLGNLREVRAEFLAADVERTAELLDAIQRRDATVFRDPELLSFAVHRGSEELLEALLTFVPIVDFYDVDILTAVGMLANYAAADELSDNLKKQLARFRAIAADRLLPALVKADDGFFLESGQGQVDLRYSLLAGIILSDLESDDRRFEIVGRNLVASVLALADDAGFLPSVLLVSGGTVQQTQGRIGPEDIYPLIGRNYPQITSLYEELGRGSWFKTVVPVEEVSLQSEEYRFVIDNVVNRTHYVLFQGIPAFDSMQLFGLTWRNAPDFEIYSKGRHYNPTTQTLMIKYYDDDPVGTIILRY